MMQEGVIILFDLARSLIVSTYVQIEMTQLPTESGSSCYRIEHFSALDFNEPRPVKVIALSKRGIFFFKTHANVVMEGGGVHMCYNLAIR